MFVLLLKDYRAAMTASAKSSVEAVPPISTVRILPSAITVSIAFSMLAAALPSPKWASIREADKIAAVGLILCWPAISGAEP